MFFKGKHEAARMELRFINKTGNRHFDKPSYIYIYTPYIWDIVGISRVHLGIWGSNQQHIEIWFNDI